MQASFPPNLDKLFKGIKSFQQRFYELEPHKMKLLVERGEEPKVLLIACSDSRVDPALLTNALPGELFVLRNVANLVPPYHLGEKQDGARAAIEYAVRDLLVEHIVVLGHAHCSGIKALLSRLSGEPSQRDFVMDWASIATEACYRYVIDQVAHHGEEGVCVREVDLGALRSHQHLVERASIRGSLDNLLTYPWIKERVAEGLLTLHGWWFDLETGDLWTTNEDNTAFLPIEGLSDAPPI